MGFMVQVSADEAMPVNIPEGDLGVASRSIGAQGTKTSPDTIRVAQVNPVPATIDTDTADSKLEEVIVTAERRTTDIQSTAVSVSVRTGKELAEQGRYTTRQILEDVPGLTAVDNSSLNVGSSDVQGNNITIRGITPATTTGGGASPSGIAPTPGVAVYVDGVYEGVGGGYDIERVELLRGPQGTLYGRSATSGLLAFHTRNPSMTGLEGNVLVEGGNYDLQHYSAAVNIPLAEGLAARVSGDYRDQGKGYYGQAESGMNERTSGRAKLLWEPNDAFSLLVGFAYEKSDSFSGGNSTTAAPPTLAETTTASPLYLAQKQQRQYWAEASLDVGPVTVSYLPAFRTWEQNDDVLVSPSFLGNGFAQRQTFLTPKDDFNTHELRVASNDDASVKWQAGAFYYDNKLRNANHNYLVNPTTGMEHAVLTDTKDERDTTSLGYFAETTISLTDSLRATLGARYDDTEVVVSEDFYSIGPRAICVAPGVPFGGIPVTCTGVATAAEPLDPVGSIARREANFHNFNYKVRLEYDLTRDNMLYGMVSTGFRPGDVMITDSVTGKVTTIVDAEKLTAVEVGSKNRFLDDSLRLNVGLFYYRYNGFGTSYASETPAPDSYSPFSLGYTNNRLTVPSKNLGGELELLYQLTANDRIGLNYTYVESRWYDKPAGFAAAQTETKRAMTPYTITANYEHVFNLPGGSTLSARIDGVHEAAHLTQNLHIDWLRLGYDKYARVGTRTIGNLNGTWSSEGGRYSISAYVRNFADAKYASYSVGIDPASLTMNWNDPRTYGGILSVRF
jgi:iron complex outermembrane receptor protein